MKYAIIKLQGKQYKVEEGQKLVINRMSDEEGTTITLKEVMLIADGEKVELGKPLVEGATVKIKVLSHSKGEKVRVATYKAKSKERKTKGHRQFESTIEVLSISMK